MSMKRQHISLLARSGVYNCEADILRCTLIIQQLLHYFLLDQKADTHYAFPAGVLLYCNFTVQYCKASNNIIADGFSRLHLQLPVSQEREEEIVSLVTPCIIEADLQAATTEDTTLQQVLQFIANG